MTDANIIDILKANNLKVTPKRVSILTILEENRVPLTALDIKLKLIAGLDIDLVTIYRNLEVFSDAKIIKSYSIKKGITHYEFKGINSHHHIVCTKCSRVEDFTICKAKDVSREVLKSSKTFSSIDSHNFELFGLCNVCSK